MIFLANVCKKLFIMVMLCVCVKCQNRDHDYQEAVPSGEGDVKGECYQYAQSGDTINLFIQGTSHQTMGRLDFKFHEKDNSIGSIAGKMNGDTLLAQYRFHSEGTSSLREVAFLKNDSSMFLGYGETRMKDGSEQFVNRRDIQFDHAIILKKILCKESPL